MRITFETVIKRGGYDLTAMLANIDRYHIEGKLTDTDRDALYAMARQQPVQQYDCAKEIEKLWAAIRELRAGAGDTGSTGEEYPAFVQPTGAHDAYQTGDGVTYNGQRYRCKMDNCVWSPDVLPSAWEAINE